MSRYTGDRCKTLLNSNLTLILLHSESVNFIGLHIDDSNCMRVTNCSHICALYKSNSIPVTKCVTCHYLYLWLTRAPTTTDNGLLLNPIPRVFMSDQVSAITECFRSWNFPGTTSQQMDWEITGAISQHATNGSLTLATITRAFTLDEVDQMLLVIWNDIHAINVEGSSLIFCSWLNYLWRIIMFKRLSSIAHWEREAVLMQNMV